MRLLAPILVIVFVTGCASRLPPSAQRGGVAGLHAGKVVLAENFKRRTVDGFDYVGFDGEFETSWSPEGNYQPEVVLRKRHSDSDWSRAAVLWCDKSLDEAFRLSDK